MEAVKKITEQEKRILSFNEACNYIGVGKATLYSWLASEKIPAFKVKGSRVWKFDRQDLDRWIEQQKEDHR